MELRTIYIDKMDWIFIIHSFALVIFASLLNVLRKQEPASMTILARQTMYFALIIVKSFIQQVLI